MVTGLTRRRTPEEAELERKRAQLATLEATLAERELELATLQAALRAVEACYLQVVGVKLAELDAIEADLAEWMARIEPTNANRQQAARAAHQQAEETARAAGETAEQEVAARFKPSDDLKRLYRELAKRFHPDLAAEDAERARRTRLMAEINAAYRVGDEAWLRAILDREELAATAITGHGVAHDLVCVIRMIAQVEERLAAIESEIAALEASDIASLRQSVEQASANGRDFLSELADQIEGQIMEALMRLRAAGRWRGVR